MLLVCAYQSSAAALLRAPIGLLHCIPHLPDNKTAAVTFDSQPKPGLLLMLLISLYFCQCITKRLALTPPSHNMRDAASQWLVANSSFVSGYAPLLICETEATNPHQSQPFCTRLIVDCIIVWCQYHQFSKSVLERNWQNGWSIEWSDLCLNGKEVKYKDKSYCRIPYVCMYVHASYNFEHLSPHAAVQTNIHTGNTKLHISNNTCNTSLQHTGFFNITQYTDLFQSVTPWHALSPLHL